MKGVYLALSGVMFIITLWAADSGDLALSFTAWATSSALLWAGLTHTDERAEALARIHRHRQDRW